MFKIQVVKIQLSYLFLNFYFIFTFSGHLCYKTQNKYIIKINKYIIKHIKNKYIIKKYIENKYIIKHHQKILQQHVQIPQHNLKSITCKHLVKMEYLSA